MKISFTMIKIWYKRILIRCTKQVLIVNQRPDLLAIIIEIIKDGKVPKTKVLIRCYKLVDHYPTISECKITN